MRSSEKVGQIAAALAKAQANMQPPKKDRKAEIKSAKGEYSYHYSDLASLIDAIRKPLTENEIAFLQPIHQENGHLVIETLLVHSSGEWYASDYPVLMYDRPQEQGSAITYGRRYSLGTMVGLAPEDDDGAAAQAGEPAPRREPAKPASDLDANIVEVAESIVMAFGGDADELIARASAFPKDSKDKDANANLDQTRWGAPRTLALGPHNRFIKSAGDLGKVSEKWKKGTLARLLAHRDTLRKEPTDAELQAEMEGREAEADAYQPSDDDVPF